VTDRAKRWLRVSVLGAVAAAVLGVGVYLTWLWTAPPIPKTMDEAIALLASPRYARLNEQRRRPYIDQMRKLGQDLSAEERRALRDRMKDDETLRRSGRELGAEWMLERAREFAKADDFQRRQMLDRIIGMQEMAAGRGRRAGGPPRDPTARAEHDAWMHDKIEQGDPQRQAYVGELWKALRQRRAEMGLPPDSTPRR
jgi:hypothetical protein